MEVATIMSFVRNAPGIEGSIESMDIDPLDPADIARLWKGRWLRKILGSYLSSPI